MNGDVLRVALEPLLRSMLEQERGDVQQEAPSSTDSATSTSASSTSSAAESSRKGGPSKKKIKVVANLPYNITRDFMKRMLPLGDMISELSIMIQVCPLIICFLLYSGGCRRGTVGVQERKRWEQKLVGKGSRGAPGCSGSHAAAGAHSAAQRYFCPQAQAMAMHSARSCLPRMGFVPFANRISVSTCTAQEEAAQRLVSSKPGDRDYRAMNLRVLLYSRPKYK